MKKQLFILAAMLSATASLQAQDEFDALRYGHTQTFGTARGMAIGGALGSIGADFATLSVNPAGLGFYRKNDISISPLFTLNNNSSNYTGWEQNDRTNRFNVAGAGLVVNNTSVAAKAKRSNWKAVSYGLGFNRLANYSNEYSYSGNNYTSSMIEKYAEEFNRMGGLNSNTLNKVSFPAFAAYQTYLIDKDYMGDSTKALSYVPFADGLRQSKRVIDRGGMNELVFSVGGNYMDKVMLGATLGVTRINFERTTFMSEDDLTNRTDNDFKYVDLSERFSTEGTGINLKLGAIFKTSESFRFGFAFHTPTQLYLNDIYSMSMESHTDSLKLFANPSANPVTTYNQDQPQYFEYRLTTPYRAIASATILFKQQGFITADVEYVDYNAMRYNFGYAFQNEANAVNLAIRNTFQGAANVRIGGEFKINQMAFRGGFNYMGSPYNNAQSKGERYIASLGTGYRTDTWYMDLTYAHSVQDVYETPYTLSRIGGSPSPALLNFRAHQVVLTLGSRF